MWPTPWKKGAKPVEADGHQSEHYCDSRGRIISCELCPTNKVRGSIKTITQHRKLYHENNEKIPLWQWELRFNNKFTPHRMRKVDKESKELDKHSLDIY